MSPQPTGTIASLNASLTMFDAKNATDSVPTKPAATSAQHYKASSF